MPSITIESLTDGSYQAWTIAMSHDMIAAQALTLLQCLVTAGLRELRCALVTLIQLTGSFLVLGAFNRSRESWLSVEAKVYRRLTSLVLQTM